MSAEAISGRTMFLKIVGRAEMWRRIEEKMQKGFRCIKLKIGAIDFEKELELLAPNELPL